MTTGSILSQNMHCGTEWSVDSFHMCMDMYRASSGVEVDVASSRVEVNVASSGVEVNTAVCVTLATVALSVTKWKDRPATFVHIHNVTF